MHHKVWGRMDTNDRDRKLLKFQASTDLEIFNRGNGPTFCSAVRRKVLNLTVSSRWISKDVVGWVVLNELSLSDRSSLSWHGPEGDGENQEP